MSACGISSNKNQPSTLTDVDCSFIFAKKLTSNKEGFPDFEYTDVFLTYGSTVWYLEYLKGGRRCGIIKERMR